MAKNISVALQYLVLGHHPQALDTGLPQTEGILISASLMHILQGQMPFLTAKQLKEYIASIRPSHIYVDWSEVKRLASTYGFADNIRPALFKYQTLSSPGRYVVRRQGAWGPTIEYKEELTPARVLYRLEYEK